MCRAGKKVLREHRLVEKSSGESIRKIAMIRNYSPLVRKYPFGYLQRLKRWDMSLRSSRTFAPFFFSSRSGFMCMTFYRRDGHVIELQTGSSVSRPEEACSPPHFLQHSTPFLTLVSEYNSSSSPVVCAFPFSRWVSPTKFSVALLKRAMHLLAFPRESIAIVFFFLRSAEITSAELATLSLTEAPRISRGGRV